MVNSSLKFFAEVKLRGSNGALEIIFRLLQTVPFTIDLVLWRAGFDIAKQNTSSNYYGMVRGIVEAVFLDSK